MKRIFLLALPVLLASVFLFTTFSNLGAANAQGLAVQSLRTSALGTGFSYQGRLTQNGSQYTGTCDFNFSLWDALGGGSQVGAGTNRLNQAVTEGLFSVTLNQGGIFGANAFDGSPRWLEISVRCPAGGGAITVLSPRQEILPAPYAIYAGGTDWGGIANIPPDIADGDDDEQQLILNGGTLVLSGSAETVEIGYPQRTRPPAPNISNTVAGASNEGTSITIGTDGLPIISFVDGNLKLAYCDDLACSSAQISTVDSKGSVGLYSSITIAPDGHPIISYFDDSSFDLRVAKCNKLKCSTPSISTIDSAGTVGLYTSIAIGSDSLPIISYYDQSNGDLKAAHCSDLACTSAISNTIDFVDNVGQYTSIAIGVDGLPIISYFDETNFALKVAHCDDIACNSATITLFAPTVGFEEGRFTAIGIGSDGLPVISHFNENSTINVGALKMLKCMNPSCTSGPNISIDFSASVGSDTHTAITIGTDGFPIISYFQNQGGGVGELRAAHCNDLDCSTATIKSLSFPLGSPAHNSMTMGSDGLPIISYIFNNALQVVHCGNALCLPYFSRR